MNDVTDLNSLRARILRYFLEDGAKQTSDFIDQSDVDHYDRRFVRKLIYGMALAGLLDTWGRTRGTWFLTSRLGYVVLVTLEHEHLAVKRPEAPE